MATSRESKRIGREQELRNKLKETLTRFEDVFKYPLSVSALKVFLDECELENRHSFLRDRLGLLSDKDVEYLRIVLKESAEKGLNKPTPKEVEEATAEIDDIDDVDFDELNA